MTRTRDLNTLAEAIHGAMTTGRQTSMGFAMAVDAAGMFLTPELKTELQSLRTRVAELEARIAEYERPADEDPIAYALDLEASCGRALATGRPCPDHPKPKYAPEVTQQVAKLRALLAGQRAAVEESS